MPECLGGDYYQWACNCLFTLVAPWLLMPVAYGAWCLWNRMRRR